MAQRVAAHALGDARGVRRFADRALRHRVVEMMASYHTVLRIGGAVTGRKHVLPEPLAARTRILARERVGRHTSPYPASRSRACSDFTRARCAASGAASFSSIIVTRSFSPFPSRTRIC